MGTPQAPRNARAKTGRGAAPGRGDVAGSSAPWGAGERARGASTASSERLPVRAVARAFELLAQLGGDAPSRTLSGLARATRLPVSTVSRLLATLEQADFVRRDSEGRYAPGTRLLQAGLAALRGTDIYDLSEPHLRRLSEASGETANLVTRADADNAIYLRQVLSAHSLHHAGWLGRLLPISATAAGQALLGHAGREGYLAMRDALEEGVTAVAAPVRGADGRIVASLSITGPGFRIRDSQLARFGALLVAEAAQLSEALGAPALAPGATGARGRAAGNGG